MKMLKFLTLTVLALTGTATQAVTCQNGIPPTNPDTIYVDHGDGTITDTRTGLMWKQCAEGLSGAGCTTGSVQTFTWAEALSHASSHTFAGHDDWRQPNIRELRSLAEECRTNPAINDTVFPENGVSAYFWSGSRDNLYAHSAWLLDFTSGRAMNGGDGPGHNGPSPLNRLTSYPIRLVRGGQPFAAYLMPASPVLSATDISGQTTSTAALAATSNIAATGYWIVVASGTTPAPTAAQVKGGTDYGTVVVLAQGSAAMLAAAPTSFSLTGLATATDYDLYLIAESSIGTLSAPPVKLPFSTTSGTPQVAGLCGTAAGVATLRAPAANLCAAGTLAGGVTSANGTHSWTCAGSGGGAAAQCAAPGAAAQGGGNGSVSFALTAGTGCVVESASVIPPAAGLPADLVMPFGALDFALNSCTGGSATVTVTYSGPVAGMQYWKHINGGWTPMTSGVVLAGNTATITLADNGPYDADPTPGRILDPSGPVLLASSVAPIPTLSQWTTLGLAGLMGLLALGALGRRRA